MAQSVLLHFVIMILRNCTVERIYSPRGPLLWRNVVNHLINSIQLVVQSMRTFKCWIMVGDFYFTSVNRGWGWVCDLDWWIILLWTIVSCHMVDRSQGLEDSEVGILSNLMSLLIKICAVTSRAASILAFVTFIHCPEWRMGWPVETSSLDIIYQLL